MRRSPVEQVVVAGLIVVVGFLLGSQITASRDAPLAVASQEDLTRILAGLTTEADALRAEISSLTAELDRLEDESLSAGALADAVESELDALAILAGRVPVTGPGVRLVIDDRAQTVTAADLLDAVQELRDAGAEALAVNGGRLVTRTWFADGPGFVEMDGVRLEIPYVLEAIGDPATLEGGLRIPGGVLDALDSLGVGHDVVRVDEMLLAAAATTGGPPAGSPVPPGT